MNILFLDIDGVLNSEGWFKRRHGMPEFHDSEAEVRRRYEAWEDYTELSYFWEFDPLACKRLQRIVAGRAMAEDCEIIVSSVWRYKRKLDVQMALHKRGMTEPLAGRTSPSIAGLIDYDYVHEHKIQRSDFARGLEIEHWILKHVPPDQWDALRIVILDDDSDMGRLMPWLVHTKTREGLLDKHIGLAWEKLTMPLGDLLREPNPLLTDEAKEKLYP